MAIGDDLSSVENRKWQEPRDIAARVKRRNIDVKLNGNALIIEERHHLCKDIPNLLHDLKLADAKQITCKDGICFSRAIKLLVKSESC